MQICTHRGQCGGADIPPCLGSGGFAAFELAAGTLAGTGLGSVAGSGRGTGVGSSGGGLASAPAWLRTGISSSTSMASEVGDAKTICTYGVSASMSDPGTNLNTSRKKYTTRGLRFKILSFEESSPAGAEAAVGAPCTVSSSCLSLGLGFRI